MKKQYQHPVNKLFASACDILATEFCRTLGISDSPGDIYWISYGNVLSFLGGDMFTNAEDMMLVIENEMSWDDYSEWYWQWIDADDGNPLPNHVNLNSWLMGARPGNPENDG